MTVNNSSHDKHDKIFGVTSANDAIKLANIDNKPVKQILLPAPLSLLSPQGLPSKSKLFKKQVIHLIRFCLKSGITKNKDMVQFLKENKVVLKSRTFDRYKGLAERDLENNIGADIWLSEKVQNGLVNDYKDISDRYDRQLVLDDILMDSHIRKAIDMAIQQDQDPDKYYKYLNFSEMMKIQAISNYTMKNKLELISKGFMVYKIKQHIECLLEQMNQNQNKMESKQLHFSSLSFLRKANLPPEDRSDSNIQSQTEEYDQDYLDQNDLAIGMNGQPIKKYLADIERN